MIKEKNIEVFEKSRKLRRQWSYDEAIDFINIRANEEYLDIDIERDFIKVGGLLKSETIDCFVVTNKKHKKDYLKFVIVLANGGNNIQKYLMGNSKQISKQSRKEYNKEFRNQNLKDYNQTFKSRLFSNGVNFVVDSIVNAGFNNSKLNAEQEYYEIMNMIFSEM